MRSSGESAARPASSAESIERVFSATLPIDEIAGSLAVLPACANCASNQLRDTTAWARSNSGGHEALISEEITLPGKASRGISLLMVGPSLAVLLTRGP